MNQMKVGKKIHPGSGRRKAPALPKGRFLESDDRDRVRDILGDLPRRRDLLIEHLHLIQDSEGCLPAGLLHALAAEMRIPMSEIYEVASFYAHFDIVRDGEERPAPVTIRVCESLSCALAGAEQLISELEANADVDIRVLRAPCMGRCDLAPVAEVGHRHVDNCTTDKAFEVAKSGHLHPHIPDYKAFDAYRQDGGYAVLQDCISGKHTVEDVMGTLSDGGLRGLGGAGFPTGRKWSFVRAEEGPRLMAVNGDEGEPGTFKDRMFLESNPHQFRGAGAYICGEESAMIESIEGKRGLPRHRPPYVSVNGIFGQPTLVNNIETLYWVPEILKNGAKWFADQGKNDCKGLRSYSVSGRVKNPGVKLVPAGATARELIEEHSGGMADGHSFKGYLPGGPSGGILPKDMADIPLDFGQLEKHGSFVGSHAVVILSDKDDMKDVALNLLKFFEDESCGQCTPCRNGTEKAVQLMQQPSWDTDLLEELSAVMADASICGLGQAAPNPIRSVMKYFPGDLK